MFDFFLPAFLFHFSSFKKKSLHSGRSKVTSGTVGRDTDQPTKVNLATLKVASKEGRGREKGSEKQMTLQMSETLIQNLDSLSS